MNKLPPENATQAANAWRVLFLLFLANLFNFFDRTIPAIIVEPIRLEWHLSDFQLGSSALRSHWSTPSPACRWGAWRITGRAKN
ncbi:hypothetical protein GCM10009085_14880 [Pseudomonas avellanae]|nr:hypothetical protein GCM10009085_14880 [Pseudomonas avellanae]